MNKKPFKDIEQDIIKAAEGYEPPFEETSWNKMEALLDKENDRRKPVFWLWWLLPLLIGGSVGGYFIFNNEPVHNNLPKDIAVMKTDKSLLPVPKDDKVYLPVNETSNQATRSVAPLKTSGKSSDKVTLKEPGSPIGIGNPFYKNSKKDNTYNDNQNNEGRVSDETKSDTRKKIESNIAKADTEPTTENNNEIVNKTVPGKKPVNESPGEQEPAKKSEPVISTGKEDKALPQKNSSAAKQKQNKSKSSRLYFIATAGAEGTGVNLFSADKVTAKGGLIIGYQFNKKFSVQTGFLAGSKKYIAGPEDYKPKDGTYWSTVNIIKVDANCLVYEVPLDVRYDFTPGKSFKIFAASGLSSYIMKEEEYHYSYNSYGYPHYGQATYTGNQHFFSVLKLTAGVEKNISKQFAILAAPALSIPLAGVGEGQVKLYSTDIMIGLRYQPLKKIKNK